MISLDSNNVGEYRMKARGSGRGSDAVGGRLFPSRSRSNQRSSMRRAFAENLAREKEVNKLQPFSVGIRIKIVYIVKYHT